MPTYCADTSYMVANIFHPERCIVITNFDSINVKYVRYIEVLPTQFGYAIKDQQHCRYAARHSPQHMDYDRPNYDS